MGDHEEIRRHDRPVFGWRACAATTDSSSGLLRTGATIASTPKDAAAASIGPMKYEPPPGAVSGLTSSAMRVTRGSISLSSSTHLPAIVDSRLVKPVTLPPGRSRLARKPSPTGLETFAKMM